jgi:hypothetical protein
MQGITRKILKNLICPANQESVSEFSAVITQRYLQDAACANFAKEKSKSATGISINMSDKEIHHDTVHIIGQTSKP